MTALNESERAGLEAMLRDLALERKGLAAEVERVHGARAEVVIAAHKLLLLLEQPVTTDNRIAMHAAMRNLNNRVLELSMSDTERRHMLREAFGALGQVDDE